MKGMRSLLDLLLWLCFAIVCGCNNSPPIIIGFSGQLTGKLSDLGVQGRNGAMLAVEKINASGGINGRPLQLIAKDDHNTPEGAITADKALLKANAVAIIGHMTSSQTIAALPFCRANGIVMVSPTAASSELSNKKDTLFRVIDDTANNSLKLAEYAVSALKIKNIIIIYDRNNINYSRSFADSFTKSFEQFGGNILEGINYSANQSTRWDHVIQILKEKKPDGIVLVCPAQDVVSLAQRIRAIGLKSHILSAGWAYTEKLVQWGGLDVENMIFAINYADDNPKPEFIKFKELYKQRFGSRPNFASAFGYEAVLALAEGLKKTDGSAQGLVDAMAPSNNITGIISDFRLNSSGDTKRNTFIATIQNGQFKTIEVR
ncbi:ABC transporter substrate-binding protein [uncultured Pseudodesulfovibrio sp.]|uniref:ABC transporter substrate-binding protein n=1 Tax=uncultured Pseudodesulfovibrio sp. TaxID=2035858 RepID=UPI0029C8ABCA|nr:ABC transporter substrate-binding protein [uncultured Pseudodesulfovibrio sp.]